MAQPGIHDENSSDERTPHQRRADEKLARAMDGVIEAYSIAPPGAMFMSNFIIVGNGYVNNEDGEHRIYYKILKEGGINLNWDECQGMLRRASKELDHEYFESGESY